MFTNFVREKIRYYLPCVVWVSFIFFLSSKHFSAEATGGLLYEWMVETFSILTEETFLIVHEYIRKLAHVLVYAVLAALTFIALLERFNFIKHVVPYSSCVYVFLFCFGIAVLDEYNQSLLVERTGTFKDIIIDMFGVCIVELWALYKTQFMK